MLLNRKQLDKPYTSVSANYAVLDSDYVVDVSANTISLTLPTAVPASGMPKKEFILKNSGTGVVTILTTGGQTIDGLSSNVILTQYQALHVISNGTNWIVRESDIPRRSEIIVRNATDFAGTLRSDVVYVVDGEIDMGSQSIVVPSGGLTINGSGYNLSALYSSANNYTMFTTSGTSGDLTLFQLTLRVHGTSSKIFNINNGAGGQSAIEMNSVNLGDFGALTTSCGTITNYRQVRASDFALIGCSDGLEFAGTMSGGVLITETIILNPQANMTCFKAGAGLTMQSFTSDLNAIAATTSTTKIFGFAPANISLDAGFILNGARFGHTTSVPNTLPTSVKARFKQCRNQNNTYVGSYWVMASTTNTTFAAANTYVKMAGTTTYSHQAWFSNTTNNAFVYDSTEQIRVQVSGNLSIEGTNANDIQMKIRQFDSSAGAYIDIAESPETTITGANRASGIPILGFATLDQNDRIEIWVKNISGTALIKSKPGGLISVTELPS